MPSALVHVELAQDWPSFTVAFDGDVSREMRALFLIRANSMNWNCVREHVGLFWNLLPIVMVLLSHEIGIVHRIERASTLHGDAGHQSSLERAKV